VPSMRGAALAVTVLVWFVVGHLLLGSGDLPVVTTAVLAAVLMGLAAGVLADSARMVRAHTAVPLTRRAAGLREKSWSAAFLRQCDPDAAGRPRPRAPSGVPAAA
jgi:hypothetical protein